MPYADTHYKFIALHARLMRKTQHTTVQHEVNHGILVQNKADILPLLVMDNVCTYSHMHKINMDIKTVQLEIM